MELNTLEIMKYLPHRYPFLLVDRITTHFSRFGDGVVNSIPDCNRLHIGVVRADIRTGQVDIAVAIYEARPTADDFGVLFGHKSTLGNDA